MGADEKTPKLLGTDLKYWSWFFELHGARIYYDGVPQSLTFTEIDAWKKITHAPILPHHVKLLRQMDGAYMTAFIKVQKEREANK